MKALSLSILAAFSVTACAGTLPTVPTTTTLNAEAQAIIADAVTACGFEAEYASVIDLIPIYGADVTAAAADICAAGAAAVAVSANDRPPELLDHGYIYTALVAPTATAPTALKKKAKREARVVVHNGQAVKVYGKMVK